MNEKFVKKKLADREKLITSELATIEKELYTLMDKMDGAFGAFVYKGQTWTTFPPSNKAFAYHLIAAQVSALSKYYEKSPAVIMAEVNGAIKEVMT